MTLDDAAAAALWTLRNARAEELGLLYDEGQGIARTKTISRGDTRRTGGTFKVPPGSLRALFHNHPPREPHKGAGGKRDVEQEQFSPDDMLQARKLGVPSYISVGDRLRRYDAATNQTTDVLAQFPIDEWRAHLMRTLLGRASDDPRGLYRELP